MSDQEKQLYEVTIAGTVYAVGRTEEEAMASVRDRIEQAVEYVELAAHRAMVSGKRIPVEWQAEAPFGDDEARPIEEWWR